MNQFFLEATYCAHQKRAAVAVQGNVYVVCLESGTKKAVPT